MRTNRVNGFISVWYNDKNEKEWVTMSRIPVCIHGFWQQNLMMIGKLLLHGLSCRPAIDDDTC